MASVLIGGFLLIRGFCYQILQSSGPGRFSSDWFGPPYFFARRERRLTHVHLQVGFADLHFQPGLLECVDTCN